MNEAGQLRETFTRGVGLAADIGTPVAVTHHAGPNAGTYHTHHNHRGDIILVRSGTTTVGSYDYSAFGNSQSAIGPDLCRFKFSSKERDVSTGLSYYGYRFFAPQWQRWGNRDLVGEEAGFNLYTFVLNAPIHSIDHDGRFIRAIQAWWCRRRADKWYKKCIEQMPPCTRGGSRGPCPHDEPGKNPEDHWFDCELKRVEVLADCAKKAEDVFKACMGLANPVPPPRFPK
ncbi:MAG: RHS repeat-associated core domain-containing protein [Verrucomicrobiae bacterium]|nr:RHS repeat-associated core domain-containing protein [Verrucomicrobiae bacterium]